MQNKGRILSILGSYRMRWVRRLLRMRASFRRFDLTKRCDRTKRIEKGDILLFSTLRNEKIRLPYFLDYYRKIGVTHFLIVDNGSSDGSAEYLQEQPDVSLWQARASYKKARFGMDWLTHLLGRYGHGHWCLTVDADEFFQYPFCDTRPLRALTDWLDDRSVRSFSAMLLDMYPKGGLKDQPYQPGTDPFEIACWFDSGNYTIKRNPAFWNLWIQGGPRARVFFADAPKRAPALNKIPLVKWHRRYVYAESTHMLLPRGLNLVYDQAGGEKASGVLLHAKFLDPFVEKSADETAQQEHYAKGYEYRAYAEKLDHDTRLWTGFSDRFKDWRQLEDLGLISKGGWA